MDRFDRNTRYRDKPYDGTDFAEQDAIEGLFGLDPADEDENA